MAQIYVAVGEQVAGGQPLVTLEAMKMEHVVRAPEPGVVRALLVGVGDQVGQGAVLVKLDDLAPSAGG